MTLTTPATRWILGLILAVAVLLGAQSVVAAAAPPDPSAPASLQLISGFLQDVIGNRTRLIQVSVIFVMLGIALLFKK